MNTRFEWDPVKASINVRKHGISFDIALRVFADPLALANLVGIEGGEERWQTIGVVEDYLLLLVAHTTREEEEDGRPERKATL
jgi:uncharacterized protein